MLDLRWILDDLPIGVWVGEVPDGATAYANRAFETILGQRSIDRSHGLFDREGRPYPAEKLPFPRVVATGGPVMIDDVVAVRPDGGSVSLRVFGYPIRPVETVLASSLPPPSAPRRTLSHVILFFLDITREVDTELERERVEARLRVAFEHAPIVVWTTDAHGVVTMSDGAGLKPMGVRPGELVGKSLFDLYRGHHQIPGNIRRALTGQSFSTMVEVGEAVYESWVTPVRGPGGEVTGLVGVSTDVSESRKLQKTAIQNDRVIALGTLAASVAHEINNPLTYVLGNADEVDAELGRLEALLAGADGDPRALPAARASVARIREDLGAILSGTRRIAAITRDLRTFSRPEESSLTSVDVRAAVGSALKLVAKEVEARARLVVDLRDTPPVTANEGRLVQVVLNLVVNALQALPAGAPADHEVTVRTGSDGGGRVAIEVSDSGPGVPPVDRERIFDPFYSTKEIGKGTGLGLFVSRNIVRGFGGDIEVAERAGGGALFRVTLPASAGAPAPGPAPAPAQSAGRGGHVVVIDDDPLVARALAQPLRAAGYQVTVIADGREGIETLLRGPVDLVFCDLMMTGMSGMDLAESLQARAPDAIRKMVFMTGGAFSPRAREFVALHRERTVDKPFDVVAEARRRLDQDRDGRC
jgi:PAS domain S-box-containing protein